MEFNVVFEEFVDEEDQHKSLSPNETTVNFKFWLFIEAPRELKDLIVITIKYIIS